MITKRDMGVTQPGMPVEAYRLEGQNGAYAEVSTLGGCLMSVVVPDAQGSLGDVLLGYDTVSGLEQGQGYMGMLIGRYANRIGGAAFVVNGKTYLLAKNDGENHLHGGMEGFDKKIWHAKVAGDALLLSLHSPDGEEGYPGALDVQVTYTFTGGNALRIHYEAQADADTIVNLTNHAYFNLSGPQSTSIHDHWMTLHADAFTEVSSRACIPTGRLVPVDGTPFDLRAPRELGEGLFHQADDEQMTFGNGYDHNFVINGWDGTLREAAVVFAPASGRRMAVYTTEPGVQFYSGNSIGGDTPGKAGIPYIARQGFCLETQHFPDSVHHANFPSCVLKRGERYASTTEYRFSVGEG